MSTADYIDGLYEGHEGPGMRWLYRLGFGAVTILSVFAIVGNVALIGHKDAPISPVVCSVGILLLLALLFVHIAWYRRENQDKKHRYAIYLIVTCLIVLDVAACIAFHRTLTHKEAEVVPGPAPTETPMPTATSGPTPTSHPNASSFYRARY